MNTKPILIVEDEPEIAGILNDYLQAEGFSTAWLARGDDVSDWLEMHTPALMLLDHTLPGMTGLEVCRAVRRYSNLPIIMVTSRIDEIDRLLGLEQGADDYVCKPFSPREVVARVKTVLRRSDGRLIPAMPTTGSRLQFDDAAWRALLGGHDLELTAIEYQLLHFLALSPGRLFTRSQLINEMYRDGRVVTDRTIDSHIRKIRKKFERVQPGFDPIQSMYGVGYRFVSPAMH
ncbi:MAG: response regulator [Formivibrio sp.]|nr:response regulator [Formivibrio sp.]